MVKDTNVIGANKAIGNLFIPQAAYMISNGMGEVAPINRITLITGFDRPSVQG